MSQSDPVHDENASLLSEAADWFVQLSTGKIGSDHPPLIAWINQSAHHEAAFRACARTAHIGRAAARAPSAGLDRRAVLGVSIVAAAGLGAYGLTRPPLGLWPSLSELMVDHRTGPGQRYSFSPIANVEVELNSRSSVSLRHNGNELNLISGEIFAAITDRQTPFTLHLGKTAVAATSADLNLQFIEGAHTVTCLRGYSDCTPPGRASVRLEAGQRLRLEPSVKSFTPQAVDAAREAAWRDNLLIFDQTPLKEAIARINLYRSAPIILTNAQLEKKPVSAVLHTGQIDNATMQIQQLLGLKVQRLPGGVILMS